MKILKLPPYYEPEQIASSPLTRDLEVVFISAGFNIEIYAPLPTRGVSQEVRKKYKQIKYEEKYQKKLTINRFFMIREGNTLIGRAFRYLLINIVHFFKGLQTKDVDVLYVASTPPTQGAMGALVKKLKKIPMIYILQDIFPDSLVGTGITHSGSILWRIGRIIENFTYRNADKIIVISEGFKQNIMAKGVPESKIEVIYNWIDEKKVYPIARVDNKLFDEYNLSKDLFYVVYAGNLGHAQNIEVIIDAANILKGIEKIKFLIFGSGGLEMQLKKRASKLNLDNLSFLPLQPSEKISEVYSLGDVSIVSCKPGLGQSAMPSKTWSIMSCGTAVLANFDKDTELQRIVENDKVGIFTNSGDVESFTEAIISLSQNPELCKELGNNGRKFILENLTREIGTSKYVEVIKSVIK